jgi:hypothetical protein
VASSEEASKRAEELAYRAINCIKLTQLDVDGALMST